MKRTVIIAAAGVWVALAGLAWAWQVHVPAVIPRGQVGVVRVEGVGGEVEVSAFGRRWPVVKLGRRRWVAVVGADLGLKPGVYRLEVWKGFTLLGARRLRVGPRYYGVRRIKVARRFVQLTRADLMRYRRERQRQLAVYGSFTPRALFAGAFAMPLEGTITGPFGRASLINGRRRAPHSGVDIAAAAGSPVRATAAGRVALVDNTYFGGWVVLIDHGLGIISGYRHLSRVLVRKGEVVTRGQIIGEVGATGRVTGAHLHFDIHVCGARVDPIEWIKLTRRLWAAGGG